MSSASKATMGVALTQALVASVALASSASENSAEAYGKKDHGYDKKHHDYDSYGDGYGHSGYGKVDEYGKQYNGYDSHADGYGHSGYGNSDGYGKKHHGHGYGHSGYGKDDYSSDYNHGYHKPQAYDNGYHHKTSTYDDYSNSYDHGYGKHHGYGHHGHHHHGYHRYDVEPEYDAEAYKRAYGYQKTDVNPYYFSDKTKDDKKDKVTDLLKQGSCFKPNSYGLHKCNGVSLWYLATEQCNSLWLSGKIAINAACAEGKDPKKKKHHRYKGMHDYMYYHEPGYESNGYHGPSHYGHHDHHDHYDHGYEQEYYTRSLKEDEKYDEEPEYVPEPSKTPEYTPEYDPEYPETSVTYDEYSAYGEVYKKFYPKTHRAMRAMQCRNHGFHLLGNALFSCYAETGVLAAFVEKYSGMANDAPVRGETLFLKAYQIWAKQVFEHHRKVEADYPSIYSNAYAFPYDVKRFRKTPYSGVAVDGYKKKYGITAAKTGLDNYLEGDQAQCPSYPDTFMRDTKTNAFYTAHSDFPMGFDGYSQEFLKCVDKHFGDEDLGKYSTQYCADNAEPYRNGDQPLNWLMALPTRHTTLTPVVSSITEIFTNALYSPFPLSGEGHMLGCAHHACKANAHGKCKIDSKGCFPEIKDDLVDKADEDDFEDILECHEDGFLSISDIKQSKLTQEFMEAAARTSPVCGFGPTAIEIFQSRYPGSINQEQLTNYFYRATTQRTCADECYTDQEMVEMYEKALADLIAVCKKKKNTYVEYLKWYKSFNHGHGHGYGYGHGHGHGYGKKDGYSNDYSHGYSDDYDSYKSDGYEQGYDSYHHHEYKN